MHRIIKIFRNEYFWLILIVALGFLVRLYKIDSPIADWHSWRQADTASVTRNFIEEGFNPLYPKAQDMSGIAEDPIPNLGRFRFVEFPIYNIFVYPFYLLFGVNEVYSRLVSAVFSLGSIVFLYFITKKYTDKFTALVAGLIYAVLPYNVFFSRTTLPEPTLVFFSLGMVFFVDRWISKRGSVNFLLAVLFAACAFLIKPFVLLLLLPIGYLSYKNTHHLVTKKLLLYLVLSLIPFVLWRIWILQHPEGIPASNWLFNGDGIRFRPAFWWWIISERLGHEILTVPGIVLFFVGLIKKQKSGNYFLHIWMLAMFLYLVIVATGNVRHDYYQYITVPILSIFTAIGFTTLLAGTEFFVARFWTILLALIFFPLMFYFGWMQVKPLYQINNPSIIEAGKVADQILQKNAVVLAPYNGDTAFLYQINRPGFPVTILPIPELVSEYGVTSYVSVNHDDEANWVMQHFRVLVDNPNYIIADLTTPTADLYDFVKP